MKSKIVENWLTKVNELTFTVPFCQLLLSKGQKVIHISSQGPMEEGKDVIAVDAAGVVHCYQLKCGNITSKTWREIKAEIDELVELPPRHPSLKEEVDEWEAYLVTNGRIANPSARVITDYAESKQNKGYRPLRTIVGSELVADFTTFYDAFIPVDVVDLQQFLELYNQPGDYELDLGKFKQFFEAFFQHSSAASRQKKIEAIRASLVLCSYLLTHKYTRQNHLETIKAYVLLLASIYGFAESQRLADSRWRDTEALIYEVINREFRQLIDDLKAHQHDYIETEYGVFSEVLTYKVRCTELLGYLAAYANYCTLSGGELYSADDMPAIMARLSEHAGVFGECTTPLFVNHVISLRFNGQDSTAAEELVSVLVAILTYHIGEEGRGIPNPYYSIADSVNWMLGIGKNIREGFQWRSYSLRALVLLAARFELRDDLNYLWRVISRIAQQDMIAEAPEDYLVWRMEKGELADRFPDATQSWVKLVAESAADYTETLPAVLRQRRRFLPLLINVMPHRFNHRVTLAILDGKPW